MELAQWGLTDVHVDPNETMLRLVSQSSARVQLYATLLGEAFEAAAELREAHRASELALTALDIDQDADDGAYPVSPEVQVARRNIERIFTTGGVSALIGVKFDADRYGRLYAVEEGIRGLARLEAEERDRLANFARIAIGAGLAERQVRLAEAMAVQLVAVVLGALEDLGVSRDDVAVREVVSSRLAAVAGLPVGPAGARIRPQGALEGSTVVREGRD